MMTALLLPVLIGATGFTTDTIQWTYFKRVMQRQADSAALAGAFALAQQKPVASMVTVDLTRNSNIALNVAPIIQNAPLTGPYANDPNAVRVALATDTRLPFSALYTRGPVRIAAEATAALVSDGVYCALALETAAVAGITMTGNSTIDLACGMITNSPAPVAVDAGGSSSIKASPVAAVGGLPPSSNYAPGTELIPYTVPQRDPYRDLAVPTHFNYSNNGDVKPSQTATLFPGTYSGMNLKGNVTLTAGTYIINGGSLNISSGAFVAGTGVTIVLTGSNPNTIATVAINGGAQISLTAPSEGIFEGVLIFQDRRALDNDSGGNINKINGNASSKLQGAIYIPSQALEFTGNSTMNIDCLQFVARRLVFTGNSTVRNTCPSLQGSGAFRGTRVRLVG